MVALVLVVRTHVVPEDLPRLVSRTTQLIVEISTNGNADATLSILKVAYCRLIGHFLCILLDFGVSDEIYSSLALALWQGWIGSSVADHEDVIGAIQAWIERIEWPKRDSILSEIWKHRLQHCSLKSESTKARIERENGRHMNDDPAIVMKHLLEAIMDSDPLVAMEWPHLYENHLLQSPPDQVPKFFEPILSWWVTNAKTVDTGTPSPTHIERRAWVSVLMDTVQQKASALNSIPTIHHTASRVAKLLLVAVTDSGLRPNVFETMAIVLEQCGWEWIADDTLLTRNLGRASHWCTLLRLVAGEWKLQLDLSLSESQPEDSMLNGCAHALTSSILCLAQLSEEDISRCPSPDALWHLRASLKEAFDATIQYWLLLEGEEKKEHEALYDTVTGVFYVYLSEWDISESQTTFHQSLKALSVALNRRVYFDRSLVLSVVTVLGQADGSAFKDTVIHELQQPLILYLTRCFKTSMDEESLGLACHVLDVWASSIPVSLTDANLCDAILSCIQRIASTHNSDRQALSYAVTCYVTIQGNHKPSSEESLRIVERAIASSGFYSSL